MPDKPNRVFITGMGTFLPGKPVGNDEMEDYLGKINGKESALRTRILKENGIKKRHYAIDKSQRSLYRNSEMAALASKSAIEHAGKELDDVGVLACATTQGDILVPGFGSMVHGDLKNPSCEVASLSGVCASGLSALKYCYQALRSGESEEAVACASEFPSRLFKASRYEDQKCLDSKGRLSFDTEFLRWMLSDGAGAAFLSSTPKANGLSLEIEWIKLKSHADKYEVCMYAGANDPLHDQQAGHGWLDQRGFEEAVTNGFLNLKQDIRRLDTMINVGLAMFLDLIEKNYVQPDQIDWMVCHYSSERFQGKVRAGLEKCGIDPDRWQWFSTLVEKGNTGAASIYIMLNELLRTAPLVEGQKILCMVPESGRFTAGFMLLTVHGSRETQSLSDNNLPHIDDVVGIETGNQSGTPKAQLFRRLSQTWLQFDQELATVPLIRRISRRQFSRQDYKMLLLNWRQQVVDGGRWIARAASNIEDEFFAVRSLFISHAKDEHMDFRMLEQNYLAVGGDLAEIRAHRKNIGSEALSSFIFQRASLPNPFDLLGAMFIIEGLGKFRAHDWGMEIKAQLGLADDAVTFFLYHGKNDDDHFERLDKAIDLIDPSHGLAERMVRTAQVTARLYRLQLEELDK